MDRRHSRAAAVKAAVMAGCAAVVAACSSAASEPGPPPGTVPSGAGLAAVTSAGTKPVSSVVWATNRDVISLDPIFSAGYPEYTADSLMR